MDKCDMGLHHPFIKMTSPISFEKSNQVVLKLQSFHEEKIRAREKVDELFSQYRPRYKPKSDPCLRPKLAKFKKIRNKHHSDKQREASVPIIGFESLLPATRLLLDSTCIQGSAFLVSNVQQSNCTDHGYERVSSVKERLKSLDFSISDGIAIDFSIRFVVGFILDAKQMLIPTEVADVHLGLYVFDEFPHSTNNCVLQLGYHMPILDSRGTLIIIVCNVEFLQNGTRDLWHYIELVASNFGDKESDESKIMVVGLYQFMKAQPTILKNKCQKEWVGMYAQHLFVGMQQTADMASLKLGFHEFIRDKGGTKFLFSFESIDLLASCKDSCFCVVIDSSMGYNHKRIRDKGGSFSQRLFNSKSMNQDCVLGSDCSKVIKCEVSFDSSVIIDRDTASKLGFHQFDACMDKNRKYERRFTLSRFGNGCCVVPDLDYYKGIRDKGGGSKFKSVAVTNELFLEIYNGSFLRTTFPAMQNVQSAPIKAGLSNQVKVTVLQNADVYASCGDFRTDIHDYMIQIVKFLSDSGCPFTMNIYPFISLYIDSNFPVDYAFFDGNGSPIIDGSATYYNMFDANYDILVWTLQKNGFGNLPIIVEIGWPTDGDQNANIVYARRFNQGFMSNILTGRGTPMRPGPIDAYPFGLIDKNAKSIDPGHFERHWGIFPCDGLATYQLNLGSTNSEALVPATGMHYMARRWCVMKPSASFDDLQVALSVSYACGLADCTSLGYKTSYGNLDGRGNISYTVNIYYQRNNQLDEVCKIPNQPTVVESIAKSSSTECYWNFQS